MRRAATFWLIWLVLASTANAAPEVLQAVTCTDVVDREPTGVTSRFEVGATVWAYLRIGNSGPETDVELHWFRNDAARSKSKLTIGHSSGWRTWARMKLHAPGRWRLELRHGGKTLRTLEFTAGSPSARPKEQPAAVEPKPVLPHAPAPVPVVAPEPPPLPVASKPTPAPPKQAVAPKAAPVPVKKTAPRKRNRARALPAARRPKDASCRALVNLRVSDLRDPSARDLHVAVDVAISTKPTGAHAPGLVVYDGRTAHALRMVRRQASEETRHGRVTRSWDMLMGRALPDGPTVTWHGYPATLAPPDAANPGDRTETNLLRVVSVLGPYVGLHASLQGSAPKAFDHSRYATVRPPGRGIDPSELLAPDLRDRTQRRVNRLRPEGAAPPDVTAHDFKRAALAMRQGELRLLTQMRCCSWAENHNLLRVDVRVDPPTAIRPHLPKGSGVYQAPDDCGRISLRDGRLVAAKGADPLRLVRVTIPRVRALLGVTWIPGDDRLDLAWAETAWRRMKRR